MHFNIRFDVNIERRKDFDAMIKREIISIQNNCFFDVANVFITTIDFETIEK